MDHAHTILIVDDEPESRMILEDMLADEFNVVGVSSGEEALERFDACSPLVVLMDVMMGTGLSGFEVCRKIRKELKSGCGIIMLSAISQFEGSERGVEAGADDYIAKPYHGELLLSKLRLFKRMADSQNGDRIRSAFLSRLAEKGPGAMISTSCAGGAKDPGNPWENRVREIAAKTLFLSILKEGKIQEGYGDSLPDHLKRIEKSLEPVIQKRSMDLAVEPGEVTTLYVDWNIFSRVLEYVAEYAVHTSADGAKLNIAASIHEENCRIRLTLGGIDPGAVMLLGESRPVDELIDHAGGMGLNLAVAKSAMALMGGSVKFLEDPLALLLDFPWDTRLQTMKLR